MPKKAKILRLARSALVLEVTLREVKPPVWRRLRVAVISRSGNCTTCCRSRWVGATGDRAEYFCDFGDGWRHEILVEDAVTPETGAPKAECLAGARACPPEDCGGGHGYAELLEAIADPSNERHEELRQWVGPDFDPEAFAPAAVNRALRGAGSAAWRRQRERFYE